MTARSTRTGEDAEDLDVEEVLALVNEHNGPGGQVPSPAAQRTRPAGPGTPDAP
ncbi:molybdopterin molybdenumtransferase MoeA, partial [Streptomyces panaciradicis]|nr:molybdopterin molybdenumtransferase MoeA [Streptomyces panaciradicis]